MNFRNKDIVVPLVILALCMVAIVGLSIRVYNQGSKISQLSQEQPIIHYYDYIIEVDGTDSTEVYTLYNCEHVPVGSFTSNNTDSLKLLIMEDNL